MERYTIQKEKAPIRSEYPNDNWSIVQYSSFSDLSEGFATMQDSEVSAYVLAVPATEGAHEIGEEEKKIIQVYKSKTAKPLVLLSDNESQRVSFLNAGGDIAISPADADVLPRLVISFNRRMLQNSIEQFDVAHIISVHDGLLQIDTRQHAVTLNGNPLTLPVAEYLVLTTLLKAYVEDTKKYLPFEKFAKDVYGQPFKSKNGLAAKMSKLRKKLAPYFAISATRDGRYQLAKVND